MNTSRWNDPDDTALAGLVPVPVEGDMPVGRQQVIRNELMSEFGGSADVTTRSRYNPQNSTKIRTRLPRRALMAGVAATVVVVGTVVAILNVSSSGLPLVQPVRGACVPPYQNGSIPFPGGYQTTLARAQSAVGFLIPVPHGASASQPVPSDVWVNSDARLAALLYNNGKVKVLAQRWPVTQTPENWFRYEVRIMAKHSAMIGRVHSEPALIVQPHTGYCPTNPALVEFYRRGLEIDVSSPRYNTATLLKIAESIH